MALTCSSVNTRSVVAAVLLACLALPSQTAISRTSKDLVQQLFHRASQGRSESSEKSSESLEFLKPSLPAFVAQDVPSSEDSEEGQQVLPEPLPPVFDEDPATLASQRLDVLKEAGAELPWPIGAYRAHLRPVAVGASSHESPLAPRRGRLPVFEAPDKRHHYTHSILHGYGHEDNVGGPFGGWF